jgi:4-diphosphocytidyl-2-C-methyl-D-erythritol kinase
MAFSLPSFAKINWTLRVLGKREDGFHELCTIFQTVSLHDTLHFEEAGELSLTCDDPSVPTGETNLVMRSARGLEHLTGKKLTGKIHLEKRIPSPGGLGGGSSNAVTAIVGLSRLRNIGSIGPDEMQELARGLGADVPFFLTGGTAIGYGRGDHVLADIDEVTEADLLIVTPDLRISTADVFGSLAARTLTNTAPETNLTVCRKDAESFGPRHSELKNDLEPGVFEKHPEVARVKNAILELGAINAAMSGSGASVFAIFDKQETRQAAIDALAEERSWRKFAVSTVSRSEYRDALGIV